MRTRALALAALGVLLGAQSAVSKNTAHAQTPVPEARPAPPTPAAAAKPKRATRSKAATEITWHRAFNLASAIHGLKLPGNPREPLGQGKFAISASSIYCHERTMDLNPQSYCDITKGKAKGTLTGLAAVALMQIFSDANVGEDHGAGNIRYRIGEIQCTLEFPGEGGEGEGSCFISKQ